MCRSSLFCPLTEDIDAEVFLSSNTSVRSSAVTFELAGCLASVVWGPLALQAGEGPGRSFQILEGPDTTPALRERTETARKARDRDEVGLGDWEARETQQRRRFQNPAARRGVCICNMAEAGNDDDPFPGHNSAAGDGDVLLNSSNEETRALLRRIETLEKSVKVTGSALAKSGIDLDLTPVPDEDSKELTSTAYTDNERSLLGRWADKRQSIWKFEEYKLPESTYTLLITEPVFSLGFLIGVVAFGIAVLSLSLVLIAEWDNTSPDNRFGVPAGVNTEVQIVQYLSVVIGVLMETVRLFSMNVVPSPALKTTCFAVEY